MSSLTTVVHSFSNYINNFVCLIFLIQCSFYNRYEFITVVLYFLPSFITIVFQKASVRITWFLWTPLSPQGRQVNLHQLHQEVFVKEIFLKGAVSRLSCSVPRQRIKNLHPAQSSFMWNYYYVSQTLYKTWETKMNFGELLALQVKKNIISIPFSLL